MGTQFGNLQRGSLRKSAEDVTSMYTSDAERTIKKWDNFKQFTICAQELRF